MLFTEQINIPYINYFDKYAHQLNIHPTILITIAKIESNFDKNAINYNKNNKTYDIGIMQINSSWIKYFENKYNIKLTINKLKQPELNIKFAADILNICIEEINKKNTMNKYYNNENIHNINIYDLIYCYHTGKTINYKHKYKIYKTNNYIKKFNEEIQYTYLLYMANKSKNELKNQIIRTSFSY